MAARDKYPYTDLSYNCDVNLPFLVKMEGNYETVMPTTFSCLTF
jgi:hypothetical protein